VNMAGPVRIGIVGGGWAGMAAAVTAVQRGAHVTLFEAAPQLGGRARAMNVQGPEGHDLPLDNGQHILIGAYTTTLGLMRSVGVPLHDSLLRLPLGLPMAGGGGLCAPRWARDWPAPWGPLAAVLGSAQWGWPERWALFKLALAWWQHTPGPDERTVAQACVVVPKRVMDELIEPLCVSALNLPSTEASAQVFWRVMRDALRGPGFGPWAASDLLLPRVDLGQLWPETAALALQNQYPDRWQCHWGHAIQGLSRGTNAWSLQGPHGSTEVDRVIWASSAVVAAKAMQALPENDARAWAAQASALQHTAIATVYTHSPSATLDAPMLALRSGHGPNGAQFVFDRGQLSPDEPRMAGVWAWVVSACEGERESITAAVMAQAQALWPAAGLRHLQTVVDKRAAYACRPGTLKPTQDITDGVWAAGDYTEGPYPSTLEAAMRSGVAAALAATSA
jgi:predicted NAD/FAD-dependent oxidoreductase